MAAGGDPEKRLRKVMDKLYHSPRHKASPSLPSGKRAVSGSMGMFEKGMLRVPTVAAASSMAAIGTAPPCRPWDRGDLLRRLATFKAMTWFGKPKAVSPVNCSRRGWINVEMDVIACEACGARLLFSTPSSWALQQVEKAAAVFSLKLDNGHKLLCPWIDNACDEALALFPPTPPEALVESYQERCSALLKLSALPVISFPAIEYMKMKAPQLEHFLAEPSHYPINLSNGIQIVDGSYKDMDDSLKTVTADLYYQVLKVICLCGWEPRLLPYVVDCGDWSYPSIENAPTAESSPQIPREQKNGTAIYSSSTGEIESNKYVNHNHAHGAYDPASTVLDCRFCGACVGLWTFATAQRPLQLYTLFTDSGNQNKPSTSGVLISKAEAPKTDNLGLGIYDSSKGDGDTCHNCLALKEKTLGLNLTIAGGPPPTKQNFRPRVSVPIVSRHLRAEFSSSINFISVENSCRNQVSNGNLQAEDMNEALVVSHTPGLLKRKRSEDETSLAGGSDAKALSHFEGEIHSASTSAGGSGSIEGSGNIAHESPLLHKDGNLENQKVATQDTSEVLHGDRESLEKGETSHGKTETLKCVSGGETTSTNTLLTLKDADSSETTVAEQTDTCSKSDNDTSRLESIHPEKDAKADDIQTKINNQRSNVFEDTVSSYINNEDAKDTSGTESRQLQCNRTSKFDPIRQHRPYCPWVAPDDGEAMPGWKLTLSAVVHPEQDDSSLASVETSSTLLEEVDDPIVSVRKLFMSPPSKRLKGAR